MDLTKHCGLHRSCPDLNKNCFEMEELKDECIKLQEKLRSAEQEIENQIYENYSLKKIISKQNSKIKQLKLIAEASPYVTNSPKVSSTQKKNKKRHNRHSVLEIENDSIQKHNTSSIDHESLQPEYVINGLKDNKHTASENSAKIQKPKLYAISIVIAGIN